MKMLSAAESLPPAVCPSSHRQALLLAAIGLAIVVSWELLQWDLPFARLFGTDKGFALRDAWWLADVLHEGGRRLSWGLAIVLCLGISWPMGLLRRLDLSQRLQLAVTGLAAALVVSAIKAGSASSCPWDLHEFGGVAHYVPHWMWGVRDGGSGRCFPAGHASSGFAYMGGWFVFRQWPRLATFWLATAIMAGLVFGMAQQARGAHFMSHTLWTGWICWVVAWAIDAVWPVVGPKVLA